MTAFNVAVLLGSRRKGPFSRRVANALPPVRLYR
jgi:hypothetical protein